MHKLCVNVDHVATIRQARQTDEPDPVWAAVLAELAGADGVTVHLREDRRHIQDRDLQLLRRVVRTRLNMEMAAVEEMVQIALEVRPDQCSLVPERREEVTTEGGLDVCGQKQQIGKVIKQLRSGGLTVSLFIDPDEKQVRASAEVGADCVEINTAAYCEARGEEEAVEEAEKVKGGVELGLAHDLVVHAGHGLHYKNVGRIASIPDISEFNIGHAIVSRAVFVGMEQAVREMRAAIDQARPR